MIKIIYAEHLRDTMLRPTFSDGCIGNHDLAPLIAYGGPMVKPSKDPAYFRRFFLELGALCWRNGLELSPSAIYRRLAEAKQLYRSGAAA